MSLPIPHSVLDFAPVRVGETPREALQQAVDLARHVEALGFKRFWLAEHHSAPTVASAATSVVIGHVAGQTSTIRVGAGGIMLPNHSPLVIAEQFGTLASLYPGRIDLGLGRAPGGTSTDDHSILRALRLEPGSRGRFPSDVQELQSYFHEIRPDQMVYAVPGAGLDIPIWLLGSSTVSAELAGAFGLPFAFAAHIAPDSLIAALDTYRSNFKASEALDRPYVMISILVVAAETDEAARYLYTSIQQILIARLRGVSIPLPPPVHDMGAFANFEKRSRTKSGRHYAIIGSREKVRQRIEALIAETAADELIFLTLIHDQAARHRSFEIVTEACDGIAVQR